MYTENNIIYAEHNMALVDRVTNHKYGPSITAKRIVRYTIDGTPCEPTLATEEYYYEIYDTLMSIIETQAQIASLKEQLASTDYQCLKWCEGYLSDEEYEPIKEERQAMRDKINELEDSLK